MQFHDNRSLALSFCSLWPGANESTECQTKQSRPFHAGTGVLALLGNSWLAHLAKGTLAQFAHSLVPRVHDVRAPVPPVHTSRLTTLYAVARCQQFRPGRVTCGSERSTRALRLLHTELSCPIVLSHRAVWLECKSAGAALAQVCVCWLSGWQQSRTRVPKFWDQMKQ